MWLDKAYMEYREPTLINVNWFMLWKDHPKLAQISEPILNSKFTKFQIHRAARIIRFACEYKAMIEKEQVEIEMTKTGPLCMNQVLNILGITRIPVKNCDVLSKPELNSLKEVMVMLQDQIYIIPAIGKDGDIFTVEQIERILLDTIKLHLQATPQVPVGVLTSENRDVWADAYQHLLSLGNNDSINAINRTLFAISFEEFTAPQNLDEKAKIMFCGNRATNRWFDKSLNFVVLPNGVTGCNGEHSPCDAVVPSRLVDYIVEKEQISRDYVDFINSDTPVSGAPQHLKWKIDAKTLGLVAAAKSNAEKFINDVELSVIHEPNLNSRLFKQTLKTSPDAFIQAALQATYHRIHKKFAVTYETASTRKFKYGRTETIRPLTADMVAFVKAFESKEETKQVKTKFDAFTVSHLKQARDCANGEGFDRHLLGLQVMMKPDEAHPFFKDPAMSYIRTFVLSTSNMSPAESYDALGFGPGCFHGYGINYAVSKDKAKLSVTARASCAETNANLFRQTFHKVVAEMTELLSPKASL